VVGELDELAPTKVAEGGSRRRRVPVYPFTIAEGSGAITDVMTLSAMAYSSDTNRSPATWSSIPPRGGPIMNLTLRRVVTTFCIVFAVSGLSHGVFEILQGAAPTGGPFIAAIGPEHQMWLHGQEGAFTVLPTFLATGIAAVTLSATVVAWALWGLGRRYGGQVLMALLVLLVLFGGGVAQLAFFLVLWPFATRIRGSLGWWRRRLPGGGPRWLAPLWKPLTVAFVVLMLLALQAAITGFVPGVSDPDLVLAITLTCVVVSLVISPVAYVAAIAHDIELGSSRVSPDASR
jgi:hypothetical protein